MIDTASTYDISTYIPSFDFAITDLCRQFSEEALNEYGLGVTPERLAQLTEMCKHTGFLLIYEGRPVGVIGGFFVNSLTNGELVLQEVIWYVEKEHRTKGMVLLKAFENLARQANATKIVMVLMANSRAEQLGRIYERMGYKQFEIQYIKEL